MSQVIRKPRQVMYAAVSAIVIRDIQNKFIKSVNTPRSIAFLRIVLEPMMHIGVWMCIRTYLGHTPTGNLSPPVFILLGALPFLILRDILGYSKTSIKGNKNFYLFRQIKPFDPIIAKVISEFMISALVFLIILIIFSWFSVEWHIYKQMFWMVNIIAYALFLLGLSLIISIGCFFLTFLNLVIGVLMRFVYIFSGIFFSAQMIPKPLRDIMLYNPIFQFIELSRECFMPEYSYVPYGSSSYLIKIALITVMFGVALYLAMRTKDNDRDRATMIEVINISKYYLVQGKKKAVFNNLSLKINSGERIALMGKNGAGKSTLLRLLCGIEKPNRGIINITSSLSWPVGVSGGLILNLTGRENTKFVCRLFMYDKEQTKKCINFVKDFAEIGDYYEMPVKSYSSGMRSRLAFGLSMAFDFDFYIIDEALAVGDPAFKKKCKELFEQKAENKGIIMVSHSIKTVRDYCTKGIFLHNNKIVQSDDINKIISLYNQLSRKVDL